MKKIFISHPMNGLSDEEIIQARDAAIESAKSMYGDIEIIDSYFADHIGGKPLQYLGKSLMMLAEADCAIFTHGWENARGCRIEHECAKEYGILTVEI